MSSIVDAKEEMRLPALLVTVKGEVLSSNLDTFKANSKALVDNINRKLELDDDFAVAVEDIKFCGKSERSLKEKHAEVQGQIVTVDQVLRTIMFVHDMFRTARLDLEREVKKQKDSKKIAIHRKATDKLQVHIANREAEVTPHRLEIRVPNFLDSMKNKHTLKACDDAVAADLTQAIVDIDRVAADFRAKLAWIKESGGNDYAFLFGDLQLILNKPMEDYQLTITSRIKDHKEKEAVRLEKERATIRFEEERKAKIKAEAEVKATLKAETEQKRQDLAKTPPPKETPPPAAPKEEDELTTAQDAHTIKVKEDLTNARGVCTSFMAKYMTIELTNKIRAEMLVFLELTDWVEE